MIINEEELNFLRKIAERSSDLVNGFKRSDFCRACGGINELKKEHAKAVNDWEEWLNEEWLDYLQA